jgi:hypothetical protein
MLDSVWTIKRSRRQSENRWIIASTFYFIERKASFILVVGVLDILIVASLSKGSFACDGGIRFALISSVLKLCTQQSRENNLIF